MIAAMLRRAGTLTLCVYALRTAAVLVIGWPLAADWGAAVAQHMCGLQPSAGDAALLAEVAARHVPGMLAWSGAAALVYAGLSPIASVAWAHALVRSSSLRECFAHALGRGAQAIGIAVVLLGGWCVLLGGSALLLAYAPGLLPASPNAELALRVTCVLLAAAGALVLTALYELACATQATGAVPVRAALRSAVRALSPRLLIARALLALGIAACFALAELAGRSAANALGATPLLLLQQSLVFAATTLRAACFALALRRLRRVPT
jgi:hypothetical protein